jgi:TPR repeat protein
MYSFGYRVGGLHSHEEKYYGVLNKFHEKRCGQNNPDSCYAIAVTYYKGDRGYQKDRGKAIKYAKKACELGNKKHCKVYEEFLTQ